MRVSRLILAVAAIAIVGCVVGFAALHRVVDARSRTATSNVTQPRSAAAQPQDTPSDKTPLLLFAKDPEPVPPFLVRDISGNAISTAALKGKVVIVNFWATWCGPCREEIPELVRLQSQYKDTLQVIGISEDEGVSPDQLAKFAQKMSINYPIIMFSAALEREYGGVAALPTSFLVNKDGGVVQKDVGVYPFDYYNLQVRALMGLPVEARIETFKDTGQIFLRNASRASELPGVSFAGLTPAQKKIALHRLNAENCNCGCKLTLAECRINDTTCPFSSQIASKIVRSIAHPTAATSNP